MNHVMLDIETLGQGSNVVITSVAAIQFDINTGQIGEKFHTYINIESCMDFDLKVEPSTLLWWLEQTDEARKGLIEGNKIGKSLDIALTDLKLFFNRIADSSIKQFKASDIIVWGRGPRFDMGILTNAYKKVGYLLPWNFRNEMCVRTMEWLRPLIKSKTPAVDIGHGSTGRGLHNATFDALYQISYVSAIWNALNDRTRLRTLIDKTTGFYAGDGTSCLPTKDIDTLIDEVFPEIAELIPGQKTFFKQ
jgi:hypothetical protein